MHKLLLKAHVQQDGSVKVKLLHPRLCQYQSTQEMAPALLGTTASKAPGHLIRAPQAHSATALGHGLKTTVLIAPPVSTVKAIITHFQPDHVHPAFIAPRVLKLTCPSPQDFCARLATSVRAKLQNQWNVMQVGLTAYLRNENNLKFKLFSFEALYVARLNFYTRCCTAVFNYSQLPITRTFKGNRKR